MVRSAFRNGWWGGWLVGGQQWAQQPVVDFGVEDRKPQAVAGEPVAVGGWGCG